MQIRLESVVPTYFEREKSGASGIWGKNISFNTGEHIHIVAPSGSGKTSLIHFIYGLRNDYSGDVFFDDQNIRNINPDELSVYRQKNISIVFQDLRLFHDHTVRHNLELKRQLNPYHPSSKAEEMAKRLGISSRMEKLAKTCSYGEQQRIAIIRSLLQPFDFLLLDEPFSHLDDANRTKAMELISEECILRNAAMIFADLKMLDFFDGDKIYEL
ncbi:MAG: ATP-binding cassette domain-containing protein [Ginsengibacter sp.]